MSANTYMYMDNKEIFYISKTEATFMHTLSIN